MVWLDGISPKHANQTTPLKDHTSFIASGIDARAVFDYMAGGAHTTASGCLIYYSHKHNSYNAISYKPCGDIPGSGITSGAVHASEFAVLVDLQGTSKQGPHWMFMTHDEVAKKQASSEWTQISTCQKCRRRPVYKFGDWCQACIYGAS